MRETLFAMLFALLEAFDCMKLIKLPIQLAKAFIITCSTFKAPLLLKLCSNKVFLSLFVFNDYISSLLRLLH